MATEISSKEDFNKMHKLSNKNFQQLGFQQNRNTYSFNGQNKKITCSHCGYHNHTVDTCFKKHGYPPGYKSKRFAKANAANVVLGIDEFEASENQSTEGLLGTGPKQFMPAPVQDTFTPSQVQQMWQLLQAQNQAQMQVQMQTTAIPQMFNKLTLQIHLQCTIQDALSKKQIGLELKLDFTI
ncbi:hypothetical protein M5689_023087 [Euphorbia peplus]|nr:hypothetical protein M5689_023087 [Euphorbia peplus]